jgi:hypothetical protein
MPEAELLQNVRDLAHVWGWTVYHTHDSRRSEPGFPDLAMFRFSDVLFAELKKETGAVTYEQRDWLDALDGNERPVYLWRPRHWMNGEIAQVLKNGTAGTFGLPSRWGVITN